MDRTTKVLLAAIALGLWANAATSFAPRSAEAQSYEFDKLLRMVSAIHDGVCLNKKIC